MNIKGKHILQADAATIWPLLQDEEVLARISPGISRIERVDDDQFRAISDISIGPVRGSFEGELSLLDKVQNEAMTLTLSQKSKIGNAEAKIVMNLIPQDDQSTEVNYNGTAKVSGRLATMGQRILGGVISTLSKQVFKELEKIIEERKVDSAISSDSSSPINNEAKLIDNGDQSTGATDISERGEPTIEKNESRKPFFQLIIDKLKSIWK